MRCCCYSCVDAAARGEESANLSVYNDASGLCPCLVARKNNGKKSTSVPYHTIVWCGPHLFLALLVFINTMSGGTTNDNVCDEQTITTFLEDRLPALGLDAETYAPYLQPLLTDLDIEDDDEQWEAVLELLQASSETESDNEEAWTVLRHDCLALRQRYVAWTAAQAQAARQAQQQAQYAAERAQIAKDLERQAKIQHDKKSTDKSTNDDEAAAAAKRALLSRYAYDTPEDETNHNDAPVLNNQQAAVQAATEQARALRKEAVTTKKEEQQKTKEAKLAKAKLKEERRKRATKGERKR